MGSYWSRLNKSLFGDKDTIKGVPVRIKNVAVQNFRGILGVIITITVLASWVPHSSAHHYIVQHVWMWMLLFWLFQPIAVPCTAMIPIFILPLCGVMSTSETCKCYFNEGVCLFILGSMLILLLNNSGFDRRLVLYCMTSGDECLFSGKMMVFKCSMTAYILSMFSNRLLITSTITQYVTPIYMEMSSYYGKSVSEPDYTEMRYIVNNAIQTSSAIGSLAIVHASYVILMLRAVWQSIDLPQDSNGHREYPDIFNFMQYSAFAFPMTFIMFLFNMCYHMMLINCLCSKSMSSAARRDLRNRVLNLKKTIPPRVSAHEMLTIFFTFFSLLILFLRWNKFQNMGWADYNLPEQNSAPIVKDACVVAIFVVALHMMPKGVAFLKFLTVEKMSELKNLKPESAILWWRFVDKNINYGYFFVFGAAITINKSVQLSGLGEIIAKNFGTHFTSPSWCVGLFLMCLIACIMTNLMTECAALACLLPFVIQMSAEPAAVPWQGKLYIAVLGVSVGTGLGFMSPFLYTPAYFCHHTGKVPKLRMILYNFLGIWGCLGILWFALCYWAPYTWDPNDNGILPVHKVVLPVTPAPEPGPPAEDAPPPPADDPERFKQNLFP